MTNSPDEGVLVELHNLSKVYGSHGQRTAGVHDIQLSGSAGEMIVLLGPSGSGKTTLLTLIAGLVGPSAGTVRLFGSDITHYSPAQLQRLRARNIGFVFQTFRLLDALSALDNVSLSPRFAGASHKAARDKAARLLSRLGISHLQHDFPNRLSQGERQRVAIARAFATDASLILADEPTASLETQQGLEVITLLKEYARTRPACVIVASHDLRMASSADRIVRLHDGRISAR